MKTVKWCQIWNSACITVIFKCISTLSAWLTIGGSKVQTASKRESKIIITNEINAKYKWMFLY